MEPNKCSCGCEPEVVLREKTQSWAVACLRCKLITEYSPVLSGAVKDWNDGEVMEKIYDWE